MMEIESPTCFRASNSIPLKTTTNSLTLASPTAPGNRSDSSSSYITNGSTYQSTMVVESQAHNFRPMTPDPIPATAEKNENVDLPEPRQQTLTLPPEGALTPSPEAHPANQRNTVHRDFSGSKGMDYLMSPTQAGYPKSPAEYNRSLSQTDYSCVEPNVPLYKGTDPSKSFSEDTQPTEGSTAVQQKLAETESGMDTAMDAGLVSVYNSVRLNPSPPNLSPKTSDTDLDLQSTGSPSQNSERRRRKPTLEDIVRRMKEVETDYYSEDSEEEEELLNTSLSASMEEGCDEVDGDISTRMPILPSQMGPAPLEQMRKMDVDSSNNPHPGSTFTENNNILNKSIDSNNCDTEEAAKLQKASEEDEGDKNGVPLPPTSTDIPPPTSIDGEPVFKQPNMMNTPPKMNGWLNGPFNGFSMFPFQPSPLERPPFARFLSPFDSKFSQEVEKDYLKCQYCERTFRRQKNLENHIENTHQGKGPTRKKPGENSSDMYFKCTHCPYTTKHQSNLYVHLRIHTGERPYICGACGVQYSQSHSLKSHIINKHDGIMSYYIKEKRTRSPRGLGYLTTHNVPGDNNSIFKMPSSPLVPPSLQQLPGNTNGLHLQHSPQQPNMPLQHSPLAMSQAGGMHHNSLPPSLQQSPVMHQQSPVMHQQSPVMQQSPTAHPHPSQQSPGHLAPPHPQQPSPQQHIAQTQQQQQSQQQQHHFQEGVDLTQKSLELAKLGMSYFPYFNSPMPGGKPSPIFHMNGHGPAQRPVSPHYNGLNLLKTDPMPPTTTPQRPQQFQRNHTPLQEIQNNKIPDDNFGAIDLSKKTKEEALDLALQQRSQKCSERGGDCANCLHLLKLRMLRMNVVRMLSILVPNLNFEEKGINAEGDSVDDLLRDVIESNVHDEEMSE